MRRLLIQHPLTVAVTYTVVGVLPLYLTSAQSVAVQRDLAFGPSRFGLVVSAFFAVSAVAAKRVGPRIDRDGPARGLRLAAAITVATTAFITFGVRGWPGLALALAGSGLANAYGQVSSNAVIAHRVRERRQAVAFSAKQSAVPLSAVLSGVLVPIVGDAGSWRWGFGAVAVLGAVLWWACPAFRSAVPAPGSTPRTSAAGPGVAASAATIRRSTTAALLALMAAAAFAGGIGNATAAFTPDAAVRVGFTPAVGALLLTAGSLTAIVVRIAAGLSADRRGSTGFEETTVLIGVGVVGLVLLGSAAGSRPLFLTGLVFTFAGAWGWQGVIAFMALRTIDLPAATSTGAVWSGVYVGTVVVPVSVGFLAERWSYRVVFLGEAAAMLLALALVVLSRRLGHARDPAACGRSERRRATRPERVTRRRPRRG